MKNDNSKGRIAATEYFEADGKYTAAIEYVGKEKMYEIVEYVNSNPYSREVISRTQSITDAYRILGAHVTTAICMNHASFE